MKKRIKMRPFPFPYNFFQFVELGKSAGIPTLLTDEEVKDAFIKYGQKMHQYDEKEKRIILRKNFVVALNTNKLNRKKQIKLEFIKYNNYQFVWVAPIHTVILFLPISLTSIVVLALLSTLMIFLLIRIYEKIRFRNLDYSEEANEIFLEFSTTIREKEMKIYGQSIRD